MEKKQFLSNFNKRKVSKKLKKLSGPILSASGSLTSVGNKCFKDSCLLVGADQHLCADTFRTIVTLFTFAHQTSMYINRLKSRLQLTETYDVYELKYTVK